MKRLYFTLGSFFIAAAIFAAAPAKSVGKAAPKPVAAADDNVYPRIVGQIDLKDGDTFVFLGDSITHQCLYTQYIEDFYYTRFPDRRIRFHNSGVGGDRAVNALRRFDDDVAVYKPKYVSILLGMNDGSYTRYEQGIFETYQQGMTTVLEKIKDIGAIAIPMTPTMHDARAARLRSKRGPREPRDTYYNGVLALYGTWLREQAHRGGLGFVDMYSPLNNLTTEQRKKDAKFTLIPDAVHPAADGQVVMAVAMLNDMIPRGRVSAITLMERNGKVTGTAANGKLTDLKSNGSICFTFKANALPWVLPEEAQLGYKLTKAGHRYSQERVTVKNLPAGQYELRIEGQAVGRWNEGQLAFGIELEANAKTPQYQQALKVAMLNKEKNEMAVRPLRNLYSGLKGKQRQLDAAISGKDTAKAEAAEKAFEKWFADFKPGVEKNNTLIKEYEDKIYQANQPKSLKYELVAVKK